MKVRSLSFFAVLFVILMLTSTAMGIEYPGRKEPKYQGVPYIEIDELYQDYLAGNVIIVDVRSRLEYDTIHTDGAIHIPIGSQAFESELKKLAGANPGKKISFY